MARSYNRSQPGTSFISFFRAILLLSLLPVRAPSQIGLLSLPIPWGLQDLKSLLIVPPCYILIEYAFVVYGELTD